MMLAGGARAVGGGPRAVCYDVSVSCVSMSVPQRLARGGVGGLPACYPRGLLSPRCRGSNPLPLHQGYWYHYNPYLSV
jgi:hypothetical protein